MLKYFIIMMSLLTLSGCGNGGLLLGGVIATNVIVTEPRQMSAISADTVIPYALNQQLAKDNTFKHGARIITTSYNQTVLLTGQVPTEQLAQKVLEQAKTNAQTKKIFNQIEISSPATLWERTQDGLLTGVIRIKLWMTSGVHSHQFKIITERKTIYVMGKASPDASRRVASVAQHTMGVQKVIRVVESN